MRYVIFKTEHPFFKSDRTIFRSSDRSLEDIFVVYALKTEHPFFKSDRTIVRSSDRSLEDIFARLWLL